MSRHGTFRDKDGNAVSVDLGEVWTPANVLERIRHEEGERLNADTVSKRLAEAGDTRNRSEGEPLASIWTDEEREQIEAILSRRFGGLDAAGRKELHDMEVDLEAEVMREEFDRRRQVEAELTELNGFRESAYVHHCRNRTGETLEPAVYEKMRAERAQLEEDTIELALRLTSANRPALGTGPQAYLVGMLTGETKPCINVRKRAILPTVAAEKRAPNIKALEFLLSQREHRFDQFCTFTHGQRVPIDPVSAGWELRQAFADKKTGLHRRLSKLAAAPFMAEHGAEMIFRASEIGGLKGKTGELIRDEKGRVTAHPHAHCLIHFKRWLPKNYPSLIGKGASAARKLLGRPLRIKRHPNGSALMVFNRGRAYLNREGAIFATGGEMGEWTRKVWAFWGSHWSIDGAIEKVREACKYVVKPTDQKALDVAELAALDIGLFGLHRVQPMGELREQVRHRRESCLKIVKKWRTVGGERTLVSVVVPDWNARKRDRKETLEAKRRKKNRAKIRQAMKAERRRRWPS